MIGLGKWEAPINTMVFKGTGRVTISDVDGNYNFKFEVVGVDLPEIKISNIAEDGNTLSATGECDAFKGKQIPITVTFNGDNFSGLVKVPFVGRIKLEGVKIG